MNDRYREQARYHSGSVSDIILCLPKIQCGSELAREEAGTSSITANRHTAFASKPAPTEETRSHQEPGRLSGRLGVDVDLRRPTEQCLRSGMPSPSEAPSGGAEALWLLLTGPASGLFESDPPLGGTLSRRYRSNGYTHQNKYLKKPKKRRFPFLKEAPFFLSEQHHCGFF